MEVIDLKDYSIVIYYSLKERNGFVRNFSRTYNNLNWDFGKVSIPKVEGVEYIGLRLLFIPRGKEARTIDLFFEPGDNTSTEGLEEMGFKVQDSRTNANKNLLDPYEALWH